MLYKINELKIFYHDGICEDLENIAHICVIYTQKNKKTKIKYYLILLIFFLNLSFLIL